MIHGFQNSGRRPVHGLILHQGFRGHHKQRRGNTFTRNIGDHHADDPRPPGKSRKNLLRSPWPEPWRHKYQILSSPEKQGTPSPSKNTEPSTTGNSHRTPIFLPLPEALPHKECRRFSYKDRHRDRRQGDHEERIELLELLRQYVNRVGHNVIERPRHNPQKRSYAA